MAKLFLYSPLLVVIALLLVAESSSQPQSQSRIRKPGANPPNAGLFPHTHIYIHNNLGAGLNATVAPWNPLKKFHTVTLANGQTDEFGFNPSFLPSFTDVQSSITWDKGYMDNVFVYVYVRDYKRCGKFCHWNITTEGLFGINSNGQADVHYLWKSK